MLTLLRSYAFTAVLVLTIALLGLLCAPALLFGKKAARAVCQACVRLILAELKLIAGVSHRIEGREHLPDGGAVVAANHQSMWETIALYAMLPKPLVVLKKELLAIPVYGWWARAAGNIAVDRKGGAKALKAMRAAAREAVDKGEQVVVFPEGTRASVGETADFQPGVAGIYAGGGAPCVPAVHDSGRFWRHPGVVKIPGRITLRFLPAIAPGLDRKTFLFELKRRIDAGLCDLQRRARKTGKSDD